MKSEKGITLTSLVLYIMLVLVVLGMLAVITASFQSNLKEINKEGTKNSEVDSFNMYFLQEVKKQGNKISTIAENEISFTTGNKFSFREDNAIFLNEDIKIAENIENCAFSDRLENGKTVITVTIKAKNAEERSIEYVLSSGEYSSSYENESDYISNEHLPNGYKQIEYLESTGTQWIDTELKFKDKYQVSMKFQFLNENPTGESWLTSDWSSSKGLLIGVYYNTFIAYAGNETVSGIRYSKDYDTEVHTVAVMKSGTFFDEQLVAKTDFSVLPNLDRNIKLFSSNHYNRDDNYFSRRIYWCKIYDLDDKLIRNYIPILDKDNVPCLYDTVEEKCYYNQGTGDFIAGPAI